MYTTPGRRGTRGTPMNQRIAELRAEAAASPVLNRWSPHGMEMVVFRGGEYVPPSSVPYRASTTDESSAGGASGASSAARATNDDSGSTQRPTDVGVRLGEPGARGNGAGGGFVESPDKSDTSSKSRDLLGTKTASAINRASIESSAVAYRCPPLQEGLMPMVMRAGGAAHFAPPVGLAPGPRAPNSFHVLLRAGDYVVPVCHTGKGLSQVLHLVLRAAVDAGKVPRLRVERPHGAESGNDPHVAHEKLTAANHSLYEPQPLRMAADDDLHRAFEESFGVAMSGRVGDGYVESNGLQLQVRYPNADEFMRVGADRTRQRAYMDEHLFSAAALTSRAGAGGRVVFVAFMRAVPVLMRRLLEVNGTAPGVLDGVHIVALPWIDPLIPDENTVPSTSAAGAGAGGPDFRSVSPPPGVEGAFGASRPRSPRASSPDDKADSTDTAPTSPPPATAATAEAEQPLGKRMLQALDLCCALIRPYVSPGDVWESAARTAAGSVPPQRVGNGAAAAQRDAARSTPRIPRAPPADSGSPSPSPPRRSAPPSPPTPPVHRSDSALREVGEGSAPLSARSGSPEASTTTPVVTTTPERHPSADDEAGARTPAALVVDGPGARTPKALVADERGAGTPGTRAADADRTSPPVLRGDEPHAATQLRASTGASPEPALHADRGEAAATEAGRDSVGPAGAGGAQSFGDGGAAAKSEKRREKQNQKGATDSSDGVVARKTDPGVVGHAASGGAAGGAGWAAAAVVVVVAVAAVAVTLLLPRWRRRWR